MPLPRKKDDGGLGAPILNIPNAHVRLFDVEEHTEPFMVTRKSDGTQFALDPGFYCTVEVIDDHGDGSNNGAKFFEAFKYKQLKFNPNNRFEPIENGPWINKENSKLGHLSNVVKPGYFLDESIPDLTKEDLEGLEIACRVKPKKNPTTGSVTGSTIDWEGMQPLPKKKAAGEPAVGQTNPEEWEDIPF